MAGYFKMELEIDRGLMTSDIPTSPPPRSGSIAGTPPSDQSYIADLTDITIDETEPEEHSVSIIYYICLLNVIVIILCEVGEFSNGFNVLW